MPASDLFRQIANLLPDENREGFLEMAARFQTVPEDDEYLQILEAIGFMTLLWKEVPHEVQRILEGANPVTETCQSISGHVKTAVENAIPSHQDLRQITQALEEHQIALKQAIASVVPTSLRADHSWLAVVGAFILGFIVCYSLLEFGRGAGVEIQIKPQSHSAE